MAKLYKPVLYSVLIFLLMLLMLYSRIGAIYPAQVLSLSLLFSVGLVMGSLTNVLEA